jgi:hypothetical protein
MAHLQPTARSVFVSAACCSICCAAYNLRTRCRGSTQSVAAEPVAGRQDAVPAGTHGKPFDGSVRARHRERGGTASPC